MNTTSHIPTPAVDTDPTETAEWTQAFQSVVATHGAGERRSCIGQVEIRKVSGSKK